MEKARVRSEEAVRLTERTQHRRLRAVAQIWSGLTLLHPYFGDVSAAAKCRDRAYALVDPDTRDYVWHELRLLDETLAQLGRTRGGRRQAGVGACRSLSQAGR
jgi:hypothetical protein